MVFDTLFSQDADFNIQPQMVDIWSRTEDGLTYTFSLRAGLAWHDGDPVTPADCIASIQRWGERDPLGRRMMGHVETMEAIDDSTFEIRLSKPYALVVESLAKLDSNVAFMMKAEHARTPSATEITEMVGSGPFRFLAKEYKPGGLAVYARNDAYVPREEPASGTAGGKVAKVDRVEWHYHRKPADALRSLTRGRVDLWESPTPDALKRLRRAADIVIAAPDPVGFQGSLRINHLRAPFDDPRVRQALAHAVDQREFLEAITGPGAQDVPEPVSVVLLVLRRPPPPSPGSEALASVDLERAKALLKEAGYTRERIIVLNPKDFHHLDAAAKTTAATLKRIGMRVKLQNVSWRQLTERRAERGSSRGWHIFPTAFAGLTTASPLTNIGIRTGDDAWFGWPSDDQVPGLIQAYADAPDPAAQRRRARAPERAPLRGPALHQLRAVVLRGRPPPVRLGAPHEPGPGLLARRESELSRTPSRPPAPTPPPRPGGRPGDRNDDPPGRTPRFRTAGSEPGPALAKRLGSHRASGPLHRRLRSRHRRALRPGAGHRPGRTPWSRTASSAPGPAPPRTSARSRCSTSEAPSATPCASRRPTSPCACPGSLRTRTLPTAADHHSANPAPGGWRPQRISFHDHPSRLMGKQPVQTPTVTQ